MKKYPKLIQCDSRGQIVIPKDVRTALGIEEGTGFWVYTVTNEGILLKKVPISELNENGQIMSKLKEKSKKTNIKISNLTKTSANYKQTHKGNLEVI